jgi:hypothetical protein
MQELEQLLENFAGASGKTARRRSAACSAGDRRSWLQSRVACSVRCRGTAVRGPSASSRKDSSRRSAICLTLSRRTRAAASSMASGIPSSRRQILTTSRESAEGRDDADSAPRARPGVPPSDVVVMPASPHSSSFSPADCGLLSASGWISGIYRTVTVPTSDSSAPQASAFSPSDRLGMSPGSCTTAEYHTYSGPARAPIETQ